MPFALAIQSFRQVLQPQFRGVLYRSIALSIGLLVVIGIGLRTLAGTLAEGYSPWLGTIAAWATSAAFVFVSAYLLAPITSVVASFFLDEVAERIERESYPTEPAGAALPIASSLWLSFRFALLVAAVNLAALLMLLIPGVNLIVFFVANAYLLGREYFELAAMRFRGVDGAREMRRRHGPAIFLAGLLVAAVLAVPILNLLTPLFGTTLMVHLHKRLTRDETQASLLASN